MKKLLIIILATVLFFSNSLRAEVKPYVFGDFKFFNYGITTSDLQELNRAVVSLGYTSSTSSTDNTGVGFELGFGVDVTKNLALEASYVDLGTLTIKNNTTGPTTRNTLDIEGSSLAFGLVGKLGDDEKNYFFGRVGMHNWDMDARLVTGRGTATSSLGDGTDYFAGLGFRGEMFRFGYDFYKIDDSDISSLSVGIIHNF